jgi:Xaa-Pro aminopeptidase
MGIPNLVIKLRQFMRTINITSQLFENNRRNLYPLLLPQSVAILFPNDEMTRTGDQTFPFRQNSDLFYLSGINQEKTILVIAPDHPDKNMREILFISEFDKKTEIWTGHKLTTDEAIAISGINNVKFLEEYEGVLAGMMIYAQHVYLNIPEHQKFIQEIPTREMRMAQDLKNKFPVHSYQRLAPVLKNLRMVKSKYEIELIRKACGLTRDSFLRILGLVRPGIMEYEIEAELTYDFIRYGGTGHSFYPIVASGINACTLHYVANDSECRDGELLLLDFGADYGNYAADCSRTIPVNGKFNDRQKEIYSAVLEVFKYARSLMKPGTCINEVHEKVCKKFEKEQVKLGLYSNEDLEKQNSKSPLYQKYYMHGTSHFLGIDVHDPGDKTAEFRPGMILTCEPGIYIEHEKTGVRIENDILITDSGNIDLMEDIPIEIADIEKMMTWSQKH